MGWARRALAVAVVYLAFLPVLKRGLPALGGSYRTVGLESSRARLILAQSCVGEAGFESGPDGRVCCHRVGLRQEGGPDEEGRQTHQLPEHGAPVLPAHPLAPQAMGGELLRSLTWLALVGGPAVGPAGRTDTKTSGAAVLDAVDAWSRGVRLKTRVQPLPTSERPQ